jgi:signal transduction histidine kinase
MAALSGAAAHVRALERQRQEALNFLSHDLRAPLSATLALIELQGSEHDASTLTSIEVHARRALALADGFVQLARAESAQGYRMELLDLRDPVVEGIDACWPQARAKAMEVSGETPEHECLVRGDRSMLTRVLVNLIDNALKHAGQRGAGVHCRLLALEAGWRVEVIDAGPPLQPDVANGLFTRFRRGNSDASGAGLGLAFVQAVAQHHGGRAGWCARAQGNVFFIELPTG